MYKYRFICIFMSIFIFFIYIFILSICAGSFAGIVLYIRNSILEYIIAHRSSSPPRPAPLFSCQSKVRHGCWLLGEFSRGFFVMVHLQQQALWLPTIPFGIVQEPVDELLLEKETIREWTHRLYRSRACGESKRRR